MKLGLHFKSLLEGAGPAGQAALKEFQNAFTVLTRWNNKEHADDGTHTDVTASSVIVTALSDIAVKVVSGLTHVGAAFALPGSLTPPEIVADTNDWSPVGIERAFLVRFTTDASRKITGLQEGPRLVPYDGRTLLLFNAGTSDGVLTHEDPASQPNYRFRLPGSLNLIIPPNNSGLIMYDGISRRWVAVAATSGTGSALAEYDAGNSGSSITIDWANGAQQIVTLTNNAAITLINGVDGVEYRLILVENVVGGFTPSFDGSVIFENETFGPNALDANQVLRLRLIRTVLGGGEYLAQYTPEETPPLFNFDGSSPLTTKGDVLTHDATDNVRKAVGTDGYLLTADSADPDGIAWLPPVRRRRDYALVLGGTLVATGIAGSIHLPCSGTIVGVTVLSDDPLVTSGSIVLDLWNRTYSLYPPTVAQTITASAKPTISAGVAYQDTVLSGWTTAVAPNDVILVNVDSVSTFTRATVFLTVDEGS